MNEVSEHTDKERKVDCEQVKKYKLINNNTENLRSCFCACEKKTLRKCLLYLKQLLTECIKY